MGARREKTFLASSRLKIELLALEAKLALAVSVREGLVRRVVGADLELQGRRVS